MTFSSATLFDYNPSDAPQPPKVVMSYGMGLDSSSLLLRWLEDPSSRDFELHDLAVVTAMTGNEFDTTRAAVEKHILPRLRRARVRFIQVARSQRKTTTAGGGVVVLDDSREPQHLHFSGLYTLGAEMLEAGTLPQLGGMRGCSIHSKANCLDPVIARITQGERYRHVIGFEANEQSRATKDALYNTPVRQGWYPLIEIGWDRAQCQRYVTELVGETWHKSACGFCVFAMATEAGRTALVQRYRQEPHVGAYALFLEYVARCLNPRQTLIAGSSAAELVAAAQLTEVQDQFDALLQRTGYALYEVRRLTRRAKKTGRAMPARSIGIIAHGSRQAMTEQLASMPGRRDTEPDGIARHVVRDRADHPCALEQFYVVAPAGVEPKARPGFQTWWQEATEAALL